MWLYMSFADPKKPRGKQFTGALILEARDERDAIQRAWRIGQNPGGEVLFWTLDPDNLPPEEFRARLLSKADLRQMGKQMSGDHRLRDVTGRFM